MPQIIVFGDIDITPLYISINGSQDLVVSGKWARRISIGSGPCHIAATTVSRACGFQAMISLAGRQTP